MQYYTVLKECFQNKQSLYHFVQLYFSLTSPLLIKCIYIRMCHAVCACNNWFTSRAIQDISAWGCLEGTSIFHPPCTCILLILLLHSQDPPQWIPFKPHHRQMMNYIKSTQYNGWKSPLGIERFHLSAFLLPPYIHFWNSPFNRIKNKIQWTRDHSPRKTNQLLQLIVLYKVFIL